MDLLKQKIKTEGLALNSSVLKVDSFINHQVDPGLMCEIGKEFAKYYQGRGITKVATIESSGIAPAVYTAQEMGVPLIILKKQTSKILNGEVYQAPVFSFTKGTGYELTMSKKYVTGKDTVLIIDDFLANGQAGIGALSLMEQAGAKVAGIGILIEKAFQNGRKELEDRGYEVYSLARIASLDESRITFAED